ncbi:MAG: hypothetical protein P1V20_14125 [Verrucomicrobiales bacterium]|nr:hypothetical protein [Verrucomicrobiales bacterium]
MFRLVTFFFSGCVVAAAFLFCSDARAESRVVEYKEIPPKFEQYQDDAGFLWQANNEAALTSGATQYLPSGMKLFLNGKAFQPKSGKLTENTATGELDLSVTDAGKTLKVNRQFWFDLERGGVRVIDTIKNNGATANVKVELKSAFQFPWQNLVGTGGGILSGTAKVAPAPRDHGIAVKFSAADGRQDTIILMRSEDGGKSPAVSASSNSRELVLTYNLSIPAGQSRSLVHWILRRNIGKLEDISRLTSEFYDRKQFIHSRVPASLAGTVHNFPATAFPDETGPPPGLTGLVPLNELLARFGVKRKDKDLLLLSSSNQLEGEVKKEATVVHGETVIPVADIAAIQGGGGVGRIPRVFLRDGRVLAGDIELKDFALKVGGEWSVEEWQPAELNLLLPVLGKTDGVAPPKTAAFVELRSGEVLAVEKSAADIPLVSMWGRRMVKLEEITELQYLSRPWPEYRLGLADGSSISILPGKEKIEFTLAGGEVRPVDPRSIRRIWQKGIIPSQPDLFEARWIELTDVPKGLMPEKGFILQGNNLYAGGFAEGASITVVDGTSALDVSPSQIVSMRKLDPSLRSPLPRFEIELVNGNLIKGGISQTTLLIGSEKESWNVPVRHIIAWQSTGGDQ